MAEQTTKNRVADLTPDQKRQLMLELKKRKAEQNMLEQEKLALDQESLHVIKEVFNSSSPYDETAPVLRILSLCDTFGELTALQYGDVKISYQSLKKQTLQLAAVLQEKGIGNEDKVALLLKQDPDMIISLLAIQLCGAVCIPLDEKFPEKRRNEILQISEAKLLISNIENQTELETISPKSETPNAFKAQEIIADQLAYILFTSGSTGLPKGVQLRHRSISALCHWFIPHFELTSTDRTLKFAGPAFDASIAEIYPFLLSAASIHFPNEEVRLDPETANRFMEEQNISFTFLPTQFAQLFLDCDNNSLRHLITGGEKLNRYVKRNYRFHNLYGPTENTVYTTYQEVTEQVENIPIGKPIPNVQAYILDKQFRPLKAGERGELCITGPQLTIGYLNLPELNERKFIPHPFESGQHIYRTGDLCAFTPEGILMYFGRLDNQVKIRGYRIELEEIEQRLLALKTVKEACVVLHHPENEPPFICSYVVGREVLTATQLRAELKEVLPDYMIPARIIIMPALPVNANGKVDRKALPAPVTISESGHKDSFTELQKQLAGLWEQELGIPVPGLQANFFELGGHSLKAIKIHTAMQEALNIEVPPLTLFQHSTIAALSEFVMRQESKKRQKISRLETQAFYPSSYAQKRLWLTNQMSNGKAAFNIPYSTKLEGEIDQDLLEKAIQLVVDRHGSLRTYFTEQNMEPVQMVLENMPFQLPFESLESLDEAAFHARLKVETDQSANTVFDLGVAPLWHAKLFKRSATEHYLMLNFHHIITDGWSMNVFSMDMMKAYAGLQNDPAFKLPELEVQYTDFAFWYNEQLNQNKELSEYWKSTLKGSLGQITFPEAKPRPEIKSNRGALFSFVLSEEASQKLKKIARELKITDFVVFRTILNLWLYQKTAQSDILTGTPIAGRNQPQTEEIMGYFINTIPLRDQLNWNDTVEQSIQLIHKNTINALSNQNYPFDLMLRDINYQREPSRSPLFDVGISWQNFDEVKKLDQLSNLKIKPLNPEYQFAKYDLWLFGVASETGFKLMFEYNTDLFDQQTIRNYAGEFSQLASKLPEILKNKLIDLRSQTIEANNEHFSENETDTFDFNF